MLNGHGKVCVWFNNYQVYTHNDLIIIAEQFLDIIVKEFQMYV